MGFSMKHSAAKYHSASLFLMKNDQVQGTPTSTTLEKKYLFSPQIITQYSFSPFSRINLFSNLKFKLSSLQKWFSYNAADQFVGLINLCTFQQFINSIYLFNKAVLRSHWWLQCWPVVSKHRQTVISLFVLLKGIGKKIATLVILWKETKSATPPANRL